MESGPVNLEAKRYKYIYRWRLCEIISRTAKNTKKLWETEITKEFWGISEEFWEISSELIEF